MRLMQNVSAKRFNEPINRAKKYRRVEGVSHQGVVRSSIRLIVLGSIPKGILILVETTSASVVSRNGSSRTDRFVVL